MVMVRSVCWIRCVMVLFACVTKDYTLYILATLTIACQKIRLKQVYKTPTIIRTE